MSFSSPSNARDADQHALDAGAEPTSAGEEEEAPNNIETGSTVFDALGVPTTIKHSRVTGIKKQSAYWQFYRVLKIPLQLNKRKDRNSSLLQTSTHLCILCLKSLMGKAGDISETAWKTTACRVLTSANAHHHVMKRHSDHPDVSVLLEKKIKLFDKALADVSTPQSQLSALSSSTRTASSGGVKPTNCFQKYSDKAIQLTMARWLIYENNPLNMIYSDLFKAMFAGSLGKSFAPMSRDTFAMYLEREFTIFVDAVVKMLLQAMEELHGLRFLQVLHDMWTSAGNNNVLGSCLCCVDSNFNRQIIPAFLVVNNTTHGAEFNADALKTIYQKRFKVSLDNCARFVTSDTTAAA